MVQEYRFVALEKVLFGVGSLARVPEEVRRLGKRRVLILTGKTLSTQTDLVRRLETLLGELWVGTYRGCQQHVPSRTVEEATLQAQEAKADLILSFGGGSPIDTAKLVALRLLGDRPQEALPQIAVSTTLSAGEFTPAAGMTQEATRTKGVHMDPRMVPKVVVLDPEVTVATPSWLWASTGVKALDHAIEALWSLRPQPITDTLALEAIRRLYRYLPPSLDPQNLQAREQCQVAAWMSIFGLMNVGVRLSHILGHQIGAYWNVPHGITSCIVLPSVMRFLAPMTLDRQVLIAQALGLEALGRKAEEVVEEAAQTVERWISSLGVSRRLRDVGAREEDLSAVAHAVFEEMSLWYRPEEKSGGEEAILGLLREMW